MTRPAPARRPRRRPGHRPPRRPREEAEEETTEGEIGRAHARRRHARRRPPPEPVEEPSAEGEIAGKAKSPYNVRIRARLKKAARLKKRINVIGAKKPKNWRAKQERLKGQLKAVYAELKDLGWKPKKKPSKDGAEEVDFESEAADAGITDEELDEQIDEEIEQDATQGDNWLDDEVFGADTPRPWAAFVSRIAPFGPPVPLGDAVEVRAKRGFRVVTMEVRPGMFVVQVVSDAAIKRLAATQGIDVGFLPALVLAPKIKDGLKQVFTPHAPAPTPAPGACAPPAAPVGCDSPACTCRK